MVGADLSTYDKSFSHVIAQTEISDQLGHFNLAGKPSLESIEAANLYILGKSAICTPWGCHIQARKLMQSGGFGVQMVQLLRTLKLGVTADLVDFATSDKPAPSVHVLASLGDDLFGTGRFHTFNRFQEAFRYAVGIHGFKLKDDKVSLQSDGHFD